MVRWLRTCNLGCSRTLRKLRFLFRIPLMSMEPFVVASQSLGSQSHCDDTLPSGLIALAVLSSSTSIAASPRGVSTIALFERLTLLSMSGHWEIICPRRRQCPHLSVLVGLEAKPEKLRSIFSFRMSSPVSGFLMTSSSFFPVLALKTRRANFPSWAVYTGHGCACSSRRCCERYSIASFWR